MTAKLVTAFVGSVALGARTNRKASRVNLSRANLGEVHGLFTFGAPASTDPSMTNYRCPTGCFPGFRTYNMRGATDLAAIDLVVPVTGAAGFDHPFMDGLELNTKSGAAESFKCSKETTKRPSGGRRKRVSLHDTALYAMNAAKVSDLMFNISTVGLLQSYTRKEQTVADIVIEHGWGLIKTAFHEGDGTPGGYQVSHLMQQADSRECILTFQGTNDLDDWRANLGVGKRNWCGLEQRVHRGFKNHLERITGSEHWQNVIKTSLPSCSKVYVVGHSLGGATSELFTGCIQRAPQEGEEGHEDWKKIGWFKARPKILKAIPSAVNYDE